MTETLAHLRVLSESYPTNTNMTGVKRFSRQETLRPCALDESSPIIRRVKMH